MFASSKELTCWVQANILRALNFALYVLLLCSERILPLLLLRWLGEDVWLLLDDVVSVVVILIVTILVGVDFAVLQLLLDDLVTLHLYLLDLNLL